MRHALKVELQKRQRIICENEDFVVLVPFWAVWPFETLVLSRAHAGSMDQFTTAQQHGLADILKQLTSCYDRLFAISFPYTMGFHQRPTDGEAHVAEWHFPVTFIPRRCAPRSGKGNLWLALKCWVCRSGTSPPEDSGRTALARHCC